MARPRKDGNKNLPENLYSKFDKRTGKTYYQYKDPRSKKRRSSGLAFIRYR
ncbi:phage integrase Arm DNA-binding domain-containing protein [Vibrio parahaemolyticus]|uniref:phage integrase Arm DNA-binding domain-containing protein n=1 Tax=Vibrio parahaemolyticus TaxID=670 RepID=UPI002047B638|nr:phage integrase Arm DNA-binding domain-containing protein [Vibrio parahaemolyticus]